MKNHAYHVDVRGNEGIVWKARERDDYKSYWAKRKSFGCAINQEWPVLFSIYMFHQLPLLQQIGHGTFLAVY